MTVVSVRPGTETPVGVRPAGPPGPAPILSVGTVESGETVDFALVPDGPGAYKVNVVLEKGEKGLKGDASTVPGPANTLTVNSVTAGDTFTFKISGSAPSQTVDVTYYEPEDGDDGVSITSGEVVGGDLILSLSDGSEQNAGKVVGDDGLSIASTAIDGSGHLIITYTDASTIDVGKVVGDGSGDMLASVYDTDGDGKVNAAVAADSVPWTGVSGKPTFGTAAAENTTAFATSAQGALATNAMPKAGGTFTGPIVLSADGSTSMHPITKQQFDNGLLSLGRRGQVRVATTANITISTALNNGDSLDGVTLATGDLVLVKNQSTASQNGIYIVGTSPARSAEFDTYDEHAGVTLAVQEGTQADTLWLCTSNRGGTLGSTAIAFAPLPVSSNTVNASLTLTGLQISINFANANTWTAKQTMAASASGGAMFRLTPGVAPTSPADGDAWTTAAGFFIRINGVTVGPLGSGSGGALTVLSTTATTAAVAGSTYYCTANTPTITLPVSPATNDLIVVITDGATSPVVARNGNTIAGSATDFVMNKDNRLAVFTWSGSTWIVSAGRIA